jgi:hypothetical protein
VECDPGKGDLGVGNRLNRGTRPNEQLVNS